VVPELSLYAAVSRIGARVGVVPDTLRGWMKQARIDSGQSPGTTTSDARRIKDLEREVKELKRSNEILLAASSYVGDRCQVPVSSSRSRRVWNAA
jgi:transposase-like protein